MDIIDTFLSEYGTTILYTILTAIFGSIGAWIGRLYKKYINDKTKKDVAKTVVQAVEQIYKDLKGEEKLNTAMESASEMLNEKGITISGLELRMLIEAALAELNNAFNKNKTDADDYAVGMTD